MAHQIDVTTEDGTELRLVVEEIEGAPGHFYLLNSVGGSYKGTAVVTEGRTKKFIFFDGIFIDGSDVHTLVILTGEKSLKIGTLSQA
jgi:hypothetical protein